MRRSPSIAEHRRAVLARKRYALEAFKKQLLQTRTKDKIAKLILHGSVAHGKANAESDIDVLVVAFDDRGDLQELCSNTAYDVLLRLGERIEPLVFSYFDYKFPTSLFLYEARRFGKEIYSMKKEEIARKEAHALVTLAETYLQGAKSVRRGKHLRVAVDVAYNACELCAKALLLSKLERVPKTHSAVVNRFGELFVQTKISPARLGRLLNKGLDLRNKARYVPGAEISKGDVGTVIELAEGLLNLCEEQGL